MIVQCRNTLAQTSAPNSSHPTPHSSATSDEVLISRYIKDQVVGASSGQVLSTMTLADIKEYALTEGYVQGEVPCGFP